MAMGKTPLRPQDRRVLDFISGHPEGVRSGEIAEACPDMGAHERGAITKRLRMNGYIEKGPRSGSEPTYRVKG